MTQWCFWGDKEFSDVYENIYIRGALEDWFKIVESIAREINLINGKRMIVDIGCGEGHSTKQVLDRVKGDYTCDLVEPNKNALLTAEKMLKVENKIGETYPLALADFKPDKKYDFIFTSHTNYYWAQNENDYKVQLKKLSSFIHKKGKLIILTLPKSSDHYKVMLKQSYPDFVYAEYLIDFYKRLGLSVDIKKFNMRMYVGDILNNHNRFDLSIFYRFIHNTSEPPDNDEVQRFLITLKKFQKKGYLDFRDYLIIINKK